MSKDVTVILNGYKRKENLSVQLEAIHKQSIQPKEILFWSNHPDDMSLVNFDVVNKCKSAVCNYNFGVWARFAFALMAKTEYVCIFDDDTVPGKLWLENCINTIQTYDGLLGTIGVNFFNENNYMQHKRVGWDNPNEKTEIVDIVGHSWFFKREDLQNYWRELPPIDHSPFVGEDMHFSYTLQKFTNKKTYVPPHPPNNREMWGSNPEIAWKVGTDSTAISTKKDNIDAFSKALKRYIDNGFVLKKDIKEKTFTNDFDKLKKYISEGVNFSFTRFSDGELFVLQNKRLELNSDHYVIGDTKGYGSYTKEEQKQFIPEEHEFYRKKLEESLQCNLPNFYRGICTRPDVNFETFDWMVKLAGGDSDTLTWSNLFINGNYERYINEVVPLFKNKKVVMVVNETANIEKLPFQVIKDFRVGTNCFINDYDIIEDIKKYIVNNDIKNHLFLISCASLSNLIIHELYKLSSDNTYFEIGSTLNPLMDMEGCMASRNYLREYWLKENKRFLNMVCEWN